MAGRCLTGNTVETYLTIKPLPELIGRLCRHRSPQPPQGTSAGLGPAARPAFSLSLREDPGCCVSITSWSREPVAARTRGPLPVLACCFPVPARRELHSDTQVCAWASCRTSMSRLAEGRNALPETAVYSLSWEIFFIFISAFILENI